MKRISNNIYQISLGWVNVFIIEDNGLTLIDTGPKGSTGKIFDALKKAGRNPYDIKQIILTHAHPDCAGSAEELKRKLRVPIWAHADDALMMQYGIGFRKELSLTPGLKNWLVYQLFIKRSGIDIEPVETNRMLKDNELLPLLGGLRVIHTPGHSKGHISLLAEKEQVLIAGDLLCNTTNPGLSVIYEDVEIGLSSIMKVAGFDFEKAVFAHGRPVMADADSLIRRTFNYYNYSLV